MSDGHPAENVLETSDELRDAVGEWHCSFVPTMGALHEGHLALIREAKQLRQPVVVSIFVNPTQFGPGEDYERYPRTLESDVNAAMEAGADFIFTPSVATVYPQGIDATPVPHLPDVATQPKLEDAHRPGHFAGVCQVVARLFDLVQPAAAVFGEKDYQQLLVIRAMVADQSQRWPGLSIHAHATLREQDGLAMSSRNAYLSDAQRHRALAISRALKDVRQFSSVEQAQSHLKHELDSASLDVDYAVLRHADTLLPVAKRDEPIRALVAARLENVRLIDNMPAAYSAQ